jgi:hypothetical protein
MNFSTRPVAHKVFQYTALIVLVLSTVAGVHAAEYFPPPDSAGGWRTATNAAQVRELAGMDLPRLEQAWEFTQRCT